jgi:hypothetical protein
VRLLIFLGIAAIDPSGSVLLLPFLRPPHAHRPETTVGALSLGILGTHRRRLVGHFTKENSGSFFVDHHSLSTDVALYSTRVFDSSFRNHLGANAPPLAYNTHTARVAVTGVDFNVTLVSPWL